MNTLQNQPAIDPDVVYHYTDQKGLLGIIRGKSIWATDIRYLNDAAEFDHAIGLALKLMPPAKELYQNEDRPLLEKLQDDLASMPKLTFAFYGIFVCSFSAERDQLSQWRAYCPAGTGFSIGFDFAKLREIAVQKTPRIGPMHLLAGQTTIGSNGFHRKGATSIPSRPRPRACSRYGYSPKNDKV